MKAKCLVAALAAILGASLALPALAHGDAKDHDKGAQPALQDDHAAMLGKPGDKVREGLARNDYKDPGWCKQPKGTVAYELKDTSKLG